MLITIFGSSITSAYWNGAATYYRGICRALYRRGHRIVFVEQDIYDRQRHRDLPLDPDYAEVRLCRSFDELAQQVEAARRSDVVAKCSGCGAHDDWLDQAVLERRGRGLVVYWDVDAPATLEQARAEPDWYFRRLVPRYDAVLTYGGGEPVVQAYRRLGARAVVPVYNAVDLEEYAPVPPDEELRCDLLFMGNRMPDREERFWAFFAEAARLAPEKRFVLGGEGWSEHAPLPSNVRYIGHVPTYRHAVVNCSATFVLNLNRAAMAAYGFSPPTRIFEAAACGCCVITDAWTGIEQFFAPGREILVALSAADIVRYLREVLPDRARAIGQAARRRVEREHTYEQRAELLEDVLEGWLRASA